MQTLVTLCPWIASEPQLMGTVTLESSLELGLVAPARREQGQQTGPMEVTKKEAGALGGLLRSIFTWMSDPGNSGVVETRPVPYSTTWFLPDRGSSQSARRAPGRLEKTHFLCGCRSPANWILGQQILIEQVCLRHCAGPRRGIQS